MVARRPGKHGGRIPLPTLAEHESPPARMVLPSV
jgi:hypothetical protein